MSIDRLLIAVDHSPGAEAALSWTVELATQLECEVYVVHAYDPMDHLELVKPGHSLADVRSDMETIIRNEWCAPLNEAEVEFTFRIREGVPSEVILDAARDVAADLIVIGARRQGAVRSLALGSTSRRVLQDAQSAVTVLHPSEE